MLTARQAEAHRFIFEFMRTNGEAPTYDEMIVGLGWKSRSNIHRVLTGLEERGFIMRTHLRPRNMIILRKPVFHHTAYLKWDDATQELVPLEEVCAKLDRLGLNDSNRDTVD